MVKPIWSSPVLQAVGGLNVAYQTAEIKILPEMGNKSEKLGIELKMIPVVAGKEQKRRYKQRSFYVNTSELRVFDRLLFYLIEGRWKFAKANKLYDTEYVEEIIGAFIKKTRDSILKGME